MFMSQILRGKNHPLGKIVDFFYRVEFQQRGSLISISFSGLKMLLFMGKQQMKRYKILLTNMQLVPRMMTLQSLSIIKHIDMLEHAREVVRISVDSISPYLLCQKHLFLNLLMMTVMRKIQIYYKTFKKYVSFLMMHNYYTPSKLLITFFKS